MAQRQSGGACRGGAWGGAIAVNRFIAHAHYAPASTPAHHGASFVNARHSTAALYSIRRLIHWLARDSGPLSRKRALHGAVPFVDGECANNGKIIYPHDVFRALHLTPPDAVKIVILGQDPYHGEDHGIPQAHGLAFSVPPGVRPPPSLRNIFKEIAADFNAPAMRSCSYGCLDGWACQGVLLLNAVLTVERNRPGSHAKRGWEQCTDTLIQRLATRHEKLVFMLWGAYAQAKRALIDSSHHLVLEAAHPSPLSAARGFFGCRHFIRANEYLAHFSVRLPEEQARRQYEQYGEREA